MSTKPKMGAWLLLCCLALTACGETHLLSRLEVVKQERAKDAYDSAPFPPPPSEPKNCEFNGVPTICQSELLIWIETEVYPAYLTLQDKLKALAPKEIIDGN